MKKKQNLTHANLREVCPCHSMFKIREITGKIGFQFCKLTFSGLGEQVICKFTSIQGKYQKFTMYQIRERPIEILCGFIDFSD